MPERAPACVTSRKHVSLGADSIARWCGVSGQAVSAVATSLANAAFATHQSRARGEAAGADRTHTFTTPTLCQAGQRYPRLPMESALH
eukprot:365195-Chlamydomonas_euryale.AAC.17